jgi:hypothetical protein
MVSVKKTHKQWFQHAKNGWFNSCTMLIVEKMSKKSLTHLVHYINKVNFYFNFHVNELKLFENEIGFKLYS